MRFHYAESMTPIANLLPLAKEVEDHGYAGYMIPDSLFYPAESDTKYAYTADGDRRFLENKPFVESFILASAMGAITKRIELTTFVVKLPVRQPVYAAKLATSVAALTNNRFNFGVGLSVWPEDYEFLGVPYEHRGRRLDECIEIVKNLARGGYYEHKGEFYQFEALKMNPIPTKPLPIMIGGHADAALKRAARHDGWLHAGGGDLDDMLKRLAGYRAEAGTTNKPFRIFAASLDGFSLDGVKRLEDKGVTDVVVGFRNSYAMEEDTQPLQDKIAALRGFADAVISKAG
ncbi:MAG: LLM class flavin-dependent oxidoreductase [Hyphomonadaceae bacterium]|nr:LLM class flavin-dependent oxidoreductase [Hyphomonadaceae bacterium]